MRSASARERRRKEVAARATAEPDQLPEKCAMIGCGRPTMRAMKKGLGVSYCERHIRHRSRHGSLWKKSYTASELKPYRETALQWLKEARGESVVANVLAAIEGLMHAAGRTVKATDLRGLSPRRRAEIAMARLRDADVPPERILSRFLAVRLIIEEHRTSPRSKEFRHCQIAKAVHRLASGYHKKYSWTEIHAYPQSSGHVLRHLGALIEARCEPVAADYLDILMARKIARYGKHPEMIT